VIVFAMVLISFIFPCLYYGKGVPHLACALAKYEPPGYQSKVI
jgi:hypothetical protein